MKKTLLFFSLLFSLSIFSQNAGDLDTTFNTGTGFVPTIGIANDIIIKNDGKIVLGGTFTSYNSSSANYIIGLNSDGSIDNSFDIGSGFDGQVKDMELLPNGQILVVGPFTAYKGISLNWGGIVRLNSDGSIDNSFVAGVSSIGNAKCLKIQSDGKILIGGQSFLKRLLPNGGLDSSFNKPSNLTLGVVLSIAIQTDGRIILGGTFQISSPTSYNIIRLNTDGSIDNTFSVGSGTNSGGDVDVIKIQSDGKILCGGEFQFYNGIAASHIMRLNQDGSRDNSFVASCNSFVYDILIQSDNKILLAGFFTSYNSIAANYIIRLNNDGTKDNAFDYGSGFSGNGQTYTLDIQQDGKIFVSGTVSSYKGSSVKTIVRLKGNSILSTYDFEKAKIIIYPNPVKDILNASLSENTSIESYEIYDLIGKKVVSKNTTENHINVFDLSNGIYILKLTTSDGVITNKFIKE